ncbi:cyclic nucleotide-binding domain-containing protein [Streptomyces avidinii]|uniref:cyclic nucleotide-binding domain-containing protein n=1 Tax=Streptomyces avidinii TaxID=1895 RepID=UPI003866DA81|nr:cyclic nucleotide-binding domain-containing protein [Streptomyces avidinii]
MNTLLDEMEPEPREALLAHAHRVDIPAGTRIFKERQRADIENGTVDLDLHVPGHKAAVIDTLGSGDLLGWSWMVPPYARRLGAVTTHAVRALEFDAEAVRKLCDENPAMGRCISTAVAAVIPRRLDSSRTRILDLFAPHHSNMPLAYAR